MRNFFTLISCSALLLVMLYSNAALAQQSEQQVMILKNGSILKGELMTFDADGDFRIRLAGGSELVYPVSELYSMYLENGYFYSDENTSKPKKQKDPSDYYSKRKGLSIAILNTIPLMITRTGGGASTTIGMTGSIGYRFNPFFYLAAGGGVDFYSNYNESYAPAFLEFGGQMLDKKVVPTWFLQGGYGFFLSNDDDGNDWKNEEGGIMFQGGFGALFHTRKKVAFSLDLAYKFQRALKEAGVNNYDFYSLPIYEEQRDYRRLAFIFGIHF